MNRLDNATYQRNVLLAMAVYVVVLLAIWPLARTTAAMPLKVVYALAPLPPLIYAIWLMARRIRDSDELEQRTHLIGLGVASIVVSIFSLIGGLLATARVLSLDACAALLFWVFPILMLSYGAARWWVARQYGSDGQCDDGSDTFPLYLRLFSAAALLALVTVWAYFKHADSFRLGMLTGMTTGLALIGAFAGLRRWMRRRERRE